MKKVYSVSLTTVAGQFLRVEGALDRPVVKWLLDSFELMINDPFVGDSTEVSAEISLYRTNVGDFKVLYQVREEELAVVILAVKRRMGR